MYLVIAIVLFSIVFAASSAQKSTKNKQYAEYKSQQRKTTMREYYYEQFYFLELIQKLIPVFQEYTLQFYATNEDAAIRHQRANAIMERWQNDVLTINYRRYTLGQIAACKACDQVIAEGYMASDPFVKEYYPTYDPWKYPERHEHWLIPSWPTPLWTSISTHSRRDADYQKDIRDLDEVAEKFGYHNFCDTILHLHYNEATGFVYSDPVAEPGPWQPFKEQLLKYVPKQELRYSCGVVSFGLQTYQIV